MVKDLRELIEKAKTVEMTADQQERQRRSFAYGSAKIENDDITRDLIDEAAAKIGPVTPDDRE